MLHKISKIIMIVFMLTTQIGESFALSAMPCVDDDMMVMNANMMDHSQHAMAMQQMSVMADEECCQKDCCCPTGLMTSAVPNDTNIKTPIDYKTTQLLGSNPDIHAIFLALPQRPPKQISL